MQKKISSFFKQAPETCSGVPSAISSDLVPSDAWEDAKSKIQIKYTRKDRQTDHKALRHVHSESVSTSALDENFRGDEEVDEAKLDEEKLKLSVRRGKILNMKRKYAQFHLELGQSDFLLHTCSICGIKYAKGEVVDEKVHNAFHKNYTNGIPFKGWRCERLVDIPSVEGGRVILALNTDPPAQRNKVQEVIKMMEIELGDGWIYHDLCKVYLFISGRRVAGCLVAEQIDKAYKVVCNATDTDFDATNVKESAVQSTKLQFGEVTFVREVKRRAPRKSSEGNALSSIVCEEKSVPASCGIRAIWVSPHNQRKRIATYLLDAVRLSFSLGSGSNIIHRWEVAFSQPTAAGMALASKYTGTRSFLVYKTT